MSAGWRVRALAWLPLLIVLTIVGGLLVDQFGGAVGTWLVCAWVWAVFGLLFAAESPVMRRAMLACLLIATLGEIFLSLVWELYRYRDGGLPLFVPPGHVLLFWLGMASVTRIPYRLLAGVAWTALPLAIALAWNGLDHLSVALSLLFILCWRFGPAPRLYAWMLVLALLMECFATWLGNWRWQAADAWLGMAMGNPPLAAGAFYCVLDLCVLVWAQGRTQAG